MSYRVVELERVNGAYIASSIQSAASLKEARGQGQFALIAIYSESQPIPRIGEIVDPATPLEILMPEE